MINGVIDYCGNCGGDVVMPRDLVSAHRAEDGDMVLPYHIVWSHDCNLTAETPVTGQTFKAIFEYAKVKSGKMPDDLRTLSEDEELLCEFGAQLHAVETLADLGWATHE